MAIEVGGRSSWVEKDTKDNSLAVATHAAGTTGVKHYITGISGSYSATVSGGVIQIKRGATVLFQFYVYDKEHLTFPHPIEGNEDEAVSAELAASGSAGVFGIVNVFGFTA